MNQFPSFFYSGLGNHTTNPRVESLESSFATIYHLSYKSERNILGDVDPLWQVHGMFSSYPHLDVSLLIWIQIFSTAQSDIKIFPPPDRHPLIVPSSASDVPENQQHSVLLLPPSPPLDHKPVNDKAQFRNQSVQNSLKIP